MKNSYTIILLLISLTLCAGENEHLDINTQIKDGQAKVLITQEKNGKTNTIEESFAVNDETDIDQMITAILKKHNIEAPSPPAPPTPPIPATAPSPPQHHWVKHKDGLDIEVEVIDNMAHIIIQQEENGSVKVIKDSFQIDDNNNLNQLIEDMLKQNDIKIDPKVNHQVIQIDRNYFSNIELEGAYYGFMASEENQGWQVITVIPDSGAEKAGLQQGDIITNVDGQKTGRGGIELKNLTKQAKAGQKSNFEVIRDGKSKRLIITAEKRTLSDAVLPPIPPIPPVMDFSEITTMGGVDSMTPHVIMRHHKLQQWLGDNHQLIAVNPGLEFYFGTKQGVLIVNVSADNKLALAEGDVILSVNDEVVTTPKQAVKALSSLNLSDGFSIEVMRKKEKISIAS